MKFNIIVTNPKTKMSKAIDYFKYSELDRIKIFYIYGSAGYKIKIVKGEEDGNVV